MPMTVDSFGENISSYSTATGARRAVGKFKGITPEEKAAMLALVDQHFAGATTAPAEAAKPEAAPAVSPPPAEAPSAQRRVPRPKKGKAPAAPSDPVEPPAPTLTAGAPAADVLDASSVEGTLQNADKQVRVAQALHEQCVSLKSSGVDVSQQLENLREVITDIIAVLHGTVKRAHEEGASQPAVDSTGGVSLVPLNQLKFPTFP